MTSPASRRWIAAALPVLLLSGCAATDSPATPSAEAEGRTVDTVLGTVTVPEEIDSVVVLEGRRDLDIVLSLGLPLAGYPYEEEGTLDLESPLADELAEAKKNGATELFLADEINIESIAAAAPDLIVSRADDTEPILDELSAIAPVVAVGEQDTSSWQDDLRLVAEATGTQQRADELVADYDARVAELSERYADVLADNSFVPMSYNGEGAETRPNRLLSVVLRDLGATPSDAFADVIADGDGEYSLEQLLEGFGDADAIVALVNDPQTWEQLQENPLYQELPAVRDGHVVRSDKQTHEGAALTSQHALDVVEQLLATL
ncbi:ABC transporter substrate-binding protein [Mycetocola reblochoni]|uniref:Periplasmic binding protein n=2 Tax=Mycetocola reblochoni TaxID=331618 RepID=A0A1R4JI13_9MICO|nr:ABC transporter substrate-binding protein [Mycetocola reblochoni]RLP70513.1 ABC transporter substrate-binding protein [Mycetocola reblochoni]SJN31659.1 Periplasmic binding protein [Mycetocola reblochoni REB411]